MKPIQNGQRFEFNIEGRFLGFAAEGHKLKYLNVGLAAENFQVKLPKHLRLTLRAGLALEDPIQVTGQGEFDPSKGTLKLKANEVRLRASAMPSQPLPAIAAPAHCALVNDAVPTSRLKIQLCHKSGCQKRGGRALDRVLEKALRDRNLCDRVDIQYTGCQKRCSTAPSLMVMPGKHLYNKVEPHHVPELIAKHFGPGPS
ncbi:(2Fe-2S) ferredoxin domain-containing protein [Altericista sp. CCNU0014]|uniref:(2Fe-2S) ferredoxin domain-containing protein n=1 Tax=Altericista sp. CCNU0014 TaxID=3082949 RepID=UPI00384F56D3